MGLDYFAERPEKANFFLRLGLALTLLWSVLTKFRATDQVVQMMNGLGVSFMANTTMVTLLGVVLLLSAILLLFGIWTRLNALFLTLFFLVTVIAGLANGPFRVGPGLWKDFALLGAALALLYGGPGAHSAGE